MKDGPMTAEEVEAAIEHEREQRVKRALAGLPQPGCTCGHPVHGDACFGTVSDGGVLEYCRCDKYVPAGPRAELARRGVAG